MQQQHSSSCTQGTKQRKENVHTGDTTTLVDVLMPRDDTLYAEDAAMEETDYELEGVQAILFYEQATGEISKGHCEGTCSEENFAIIMH